MEKYIDLPDNWSIHKIMNLSSYLLNSMGVQSDISLYISYPDFTSLMQENTYLGQYSNETYGGPGIQSLCMYASSGRILISPTNDKDFVEFTLNGEDHKYYITNKLKEYKQEFDGLVNT
jgi:hypothetical protein